MNEDKNKMRELYKKRRIETLDKSRRGKDKTTLREMLQLTKEKEFKTIYIKESMRFKKYKYDHESVIISCLNEENEDDNREIKKLWVNIALCKPEVKETMNIYHISNLCEIWEIA